MPVSFSDEPTVVDAAKVDGDANVGTGDGEGERKSSIVADVSDSEHVLTEWTEDFTQQNRYHRNASVLFRGLDWSWKDFLKHSAWTFWAIFLMMVFGMGDHVFEEGSPTCPNEQQQAEGVVRNEQMCELGETFMNGVGDMRFLSGFILAGFVMSSRELWLRRRTAYCALCGATRNLLINVNSLIPLDHRKLLSRWAILGYELSVLKARFLVDSEEGRMYLEKAQLLREDEWGAMVNGDRHTTTWYWVQAKATKLKEKGDITDIELQTICNAVTLSRDRANDLMSCIDRDQPPPYVTVVALLINANLFFWSTSKGFEWAVGAHDYGKWAVWTYPALYVEILILFFGTTIYAMLFDISAKLYNPFGPREIDIPHHAVGTGIRNLAKALSKTDSVLPSTMYKGTKTAAAVDEPVLVEQSISNSFGPSNATSLADMDFELAAVGVKRRNIARSKSAAPLRKQPANEVSQFRHTQLRTWAF